LKRYLLVLEANSQRMMRLLKDMLLVVSLEQISFVMQPECVWLEEEIERKTQMYE
jgi:two-component system, OmpR family, lantibiotic biosynthesis sensor histidine kinase NisK/SpaK